MNYAFRWEKLRNVSARLINRACMFIHIYAHIKYIMIYIMISNYAIIVFKYCISSNIFNRDYVYRISNISSYSLYNLLEKK